jgi:hypothetical protein
MSNNKQSIKIYTEEQVIRAIQMAAKHRYLFDSEENEIINLLSPIELPSDEEIEEKLNVAYGNGYEQGEMDFYKKMKGQGNEYADGYAEGYKRALDYMTDTLKNKIEIQGGNK